MKKDYLDSGRMADTADLVVLGAYYGTGNKGGMKSVFLMGVYDDKRDKWLTVTKVGNGFDDKTLAKLQKQIDMTEIKKNLNKVPEWLVVSKTLVPDFVVKNPKNSPVWELTGAEFSKSDTHTADGISIRFPRVTKIRDDKSWKEATSLKQLKELFKTSKETSDVYEVEETRTTKRKLSEDEEENLMSKKKAIKVESDRGFLKPVLKGMKFYVSGKLPKAEKTKRTIIGYGGLVLDEMNAGSATHIVVENKIEIIPGACSDKIIILTDIGSLIENIV